MTRKLISLAGVLVAVCSFTVGSTDAEARHCRTFRTRFCRQPCHQQSFNQQSCNTGCQQAANIGGCNTGCNGNQQTSNYAPGQVTYGTPGVAGEGGQPAPAPAPEVQATAPAPNN